MTRTATNHTGIDPRELLGRAIATTGSTIEAVTPDQLANPTPCDDFDVRGMLGHLVGVLDRMTALGRGEDPFAVVESLADDDTWMAAWTAAAERVVNAWSDETVLRGPMALPWVQGTGADVLVTYFCELTAHTWDLAVATGQAPVWDDAVIATALDARGFLPAENRLDVFTQVSEAMGLDEVAVPFAEAIAVGADAPLIDQLVAWTGRQPRR